MTSTHTQRIGKRHSPERTPFAAARDVTEDDSAQDHWLIVHSLTKSPKHSDDWHKLTRIALGKEEDTDLAFMENYIRMASRTLESAELLNVPRAGWPPMIDSRIQIRSRPKPDYMTYVVGSMGADPRSVAPQLESAAIGQGPVRRSSPQSQLKTHTVPEEPVVRISSLLKKGSLFLAVLCVVSLITWAISDVPIMSPFIALLVLISLPFTYLMGSQMQRRV